MGVETLIVSRHGESTYNERGLANGDPKIAVGLSERGESQARRLALLLAPEPIDLCITSEFPRTKQTADLALAGRSVPRQVLPLLNDPPLGIFEGKPVKDIAAWWIDNGPDVATPGTRWSNRRAFEGYVDALRHLLDLTERTVLVVAHNMVVAWLVKAARQQRSPVEVGFANPEWLRANDLVQALARLEHDPYAFWSLSVES